MCPSLTLFTSGFHEVVVCILHGQDGSLGALFIDDMILHYRSIAEKSTVHGLDLTDNKLRSTVVLRILLDTIQRQ